MRLKYLLLVAAVFMRSAIACFGGVVFEGRVASDILQEKRLVRIYVPPGYDASPAARYPVLYLHDGQNVFTTVGPHVAFGWGNWALDKTVDALCAAGKIQPIIMVAVDCSPSRYTEYRGPAYPYAKEELAALAPTPPEPADNHRFKQYTRFIMEELKTKIDREYRTKPGPHDTGIMGSSMGGICSVVMAWEHPEVFGKAASLSGAFQVENRFFLKQVLQKHSGGPKDVRIYLDSGMVDFSGGDDGRQDTTAVAKALRQIGGPVNNGLLHFVDEHLLTEPELEQAGAPKDKWKETQTSQHNELYWRLRAGRALVFLFPPSRPDQK